MISRTGSRRIRSIVRSNSSREVGSIQCTSSNTISTGRLRLKSSNRPSKASSVFSFFSCGVRFISDSAPPLGSDNRSATSACRTPATASSNSSASCSLLRER